MLAYRGSREWLRMWAPAIVPGAYMHNHVHDPDINAVLDARAMSRSGQTYAWLVEAVHQAMKLATDVFRRQV